METHILMLVAIFGIISYSQASLPPTQCKRTYEKVGGFNDRANRAMPKLLLNDRNVNSDKNDGHVLDMKAFEASIHSLACRCAAKAKEKGYKVFGLQYLGECWSGPTAEYNYSKYGAAEASKSFQFAGYPPCNISNEQECVGGRWINYVYRLKEKTCRTPLGLESHALADSQILASSEYNSAHRAANGRLHFRAGAGRTGAWSARTNNAEQWFQVDFKKIAKITKIATQGRQDANQWVKSYTLSYSRDGVFWSTYTAEVFTGNSDRSTVVSHELKQVIYARYLRIHPRSWQGHISMRAEVYGCTSGFHVPAETCVSVLGMQTKTIPDSNITASSMWDANHSPSRARLGTVREGSKTGAWSARRNDAYQWIQVDFGRFVKVSRIATQGRQDANQWVKSYTVQYSVDGGHFKDYKGGQVLMANSDRNTIVGNNLEPAIIARYIRIRPKSWSGHVSMRFEIYGCTSGFEIPTGPKCGYALGLQSHVVSDSQIRASSEWNSGHRAANGRLHFRAGAGRTGAWSARTNNAEQWFQVDFKKIAKITKIATQGRQDANQWVKSYTLSYSRDGVFWSTYTAEVFTGNSDRSTVVSHELKQVIYARYLRIHPRSWQGHISMRAEVYGCTSGFHVPAETCVSVLGMQTKTIPDSNITASSMWDANHSPSRARLGTVREGRKTGAWSAKRNDANQWIQVDFGRFVKVSRIATQGRQDANQWVKSYTVQYSVDGGHFKDYKGGQVLMANSDRNTIVGNNLEPAIIARYIRIRPKSWSGHVSLRFEIYGCTSGFEIPTGPKCGYALGLQSHALSDSQIRASSEWNSGHRAANGRLHFRAGAGRTGAWSARTNNAEQWFQVDFKKIAKITKIATQGRQDANQWVKSYTLSYSRDGVFWSTYTAEVFTGNSDRSTVVSHELKQVIYARYLRIHPRSWQGHISMRAEVYGCTSGFHVPAETCVSVLGMQTKTIPDSNITASSMWDANHSPSRARLGTVREGRKTGAWSAKRNDANQWIQVDFGRFVKVSRIATQGRQDANQWVKSYTVQYSVDGGHFKDYKGGQVLMANSDRNTIVGNNLEPAIIARYIRIRPKSWSGHVSLRFEIYGCTSGFEIPTGPKCGYALGLQSHALSDSQIRASSEWNSGHRAANGRLHFRAGAGRTGAWSARTNNAEQWFQVDFKKIAKITKIATQGRQDANQWVKSYTLSYSRDGVFWSTYTAEVFTGNSDRSTVVSHELKQVIYARYLRIHPRSWQGHISMRAEVYGCTSGFHVPAETCVSVLGMQTKTIPDSNITASSMWDANHSPSRARLGTVREGRKTGAWSAKRNDANQWIQVDFGRFVKVSRIATQGRQDANQWVKSYTVQYSVDGGHFKDYKGGQVLMANSDRNTIVGNNLEPAIIARYIRIRPKSWSGHVSLRFEIYGCTSGFEIPTGPKCGYALGLQSHALSDSQIRASSEWSSATRAANGRLHFRAGAGRTGAWSARTNNAEQWFQVDFKKIAKITKIATQGRQDANQWVKSYTLSYSRDGVFWSTYTAEVFTGNSDRSTVVSHELKQVIYARYLRIHPRSWQGHISMRAEVYGCTSGFHVPAETCVSVLGMQTKTIPDSNITASSMWDANHSPSRARLGTVREGRKTGAWSAKRNDANQWIQVDFGRFVKVSRIATQGRQDANQWVKSYTVQYSVDGGHFKDYKGGQVLMANSDRNTIVGNNLEPAIIARYIRIRPKSWSGHVSLRFEIYGCTSGFEIPTGPKCGYALGLQSHALSDSQIRASSEWSSATRAANGRLHFRAGAGRTGAWSARTNNAEQWFQVDFKKIAKITKIATQGRQDANQWVKSYTLSYSRDGVFWSTYTAEVFTGNSDRSTVVSHELKQVIYARYLRIHPRSWQGHISMRAEVYGCTSGFHVPAETCVSVLGMQTKTIPDSNITASSMWDANHSPSRARLGTVREGRKTGAWSAKRNDANQWIQVDFGRFVKVSRIATQGRQDANQWVKSYTVQYSVDGGHFKDYKGGQVLMANSDRNTIVGNNLEPAIIARYIRIRPKSWSGHVSLRFEIYGCTSGFEIPTGPKCGYALGLQSHALSDSQIRASSEWSSATRAANGRLHFRAGAGRTGAWSARTNNAEQWFQVDFKKIAKITKIATQGRQDANQWVKSYTLSYSRDGVFWSTYTAEVFTGNSDRSTVVSHELKQVIYARYLRIHPRSWQGHISMRAEVYGCTSGFHVPAETCVSVLGMQTKTIPDSNITASSMWDANHSPSRARLGTVREGSKTGAWSAKRNDAYQWIQVDFGRFVKVSRIATQGRQDADQWVKSYTVQYSVDGGHFKDYKGGQVLMANSDRNTIVGNNLEPPIIARYIRIRPKTWYGHVSLRFEIYGCTSGI